MPLCSFKGCSIDKRFEDRSRLSERLSNAIELAHSVVASANHRFDFSSMRIQSNQRRLRLRARWRIFASLVSCSKLFFNLLQSFADRIYGRLLEIWIQRRVDAHAVVYKGVFLE